MTGTGTQNDPFIVSTFPDFLTAAATAEAYVAFDSTAEHKVIDLNDTSYATGLSAAITLNCTHIAGNGWSIRNLNINWSDCYLFSVPDDKTVTVEDLKCPNIVMNTSTGKGLFRAGGSFTLKNCHFSGAYTHSGGGTISARLLYVDTEGSFTMQCCSLHFQVEAPAMRQLFIKGTFDACSFVLDGQMSKQLQHTHRKVLQ